MMKEPYDLREEKRTGYIYQLSPIDFWYGWTKLPPIEQPNNTLNIITWPTDYEHQDWEDMDRLAVAGMKAARMIGWPGDMREGPFISGIPLDGDPASGVLIGWKEDNNGTTYIVSPEPLPWLINVDRQAVFYY